MVDAAHSSRIPLHVMESRRSVPNLMIDQMGTSGQEGASRQDVSAQSAPPLHAAATIFTIHANETTTYEEMSTSSTATTDGSSTISSSGRPTLQRRRSSVLFASRIVANRSIMEGTSNVVLASGGEGTHTSRRDLLGVSRGMSASGSLMDFEMHVHPSVSRRMLSSIVDSKRGSETTATTISDEDYDAMDVEPMDVEDQVVDTNNKLYSWGKGIQSLHDDSNDRILTLDNEDNDGSKLDQEMQVSSRLGSKLILAIATGQHHSACATSQGTLYIVGKNVHGCVDPNSSDGEHISRPRLLDCISHVRVSQVSCGYDHTAVLSSNGSVVSIFF